jgi:predicted amidophosphoribosyltransferase
VIIHVGTAGVLYTHVGTAGVYNTHVLCASCRRRLQGVPLCPKCALANQAAFYEAEEKQ